MSKQNLKIGIDIDGVLINTDPLAYLEFCEKELGWKIDYEEFGITGPSYKTTGVSSSGEIRRSYERFIHEVEDSQHPIEGAHEALIELGKYAELFLITARTGVMRGVTESFLEEHLPDVQYTEISMDNLEGKAKKIIEFKVNYYIDDSYREITAILQNKDVNVTLIPFPPFRSIARWQDIQDDRIHWLRVWGEITDGVDLEKHPEIRKKAWEEITEVILNKNSA